MSLTPYYEWDGITIYCGDCLEVIPQMDAESVDTIITDPPYGLEFMGKDWDHGTPGVRFWQAALRVAKPGAMLLAFGGTRTHHRLMCAIEDAGWELRDVIMWVYGSGFPKSLSISKAIDRVAIVVCPDCRGSGRHPISQELGGTPGTVRVAATGPDGQSWWWLDEPCQRCDGGGEVRGAEREIADAQPDRYRDGRIRRNRGPRGNMLGNNAHGTLVTAPATEAAKLWDGWGTALKPAWEPIIVAMKPRDGTFANNALEHGVAGLWVDGGRVSSRDNLNGGAYAKTGTLRNDGWGMQRGGAGEYQQPSGRWPANLIHDGSDEVVGLFPVSKSRDGKTTSNSRHIYGRYEKNYQKIIRKDKEISAARFFYCAKASRKERGEGNNHPTVKPLALMRYLCRLTRTPTGGVILDMFMGSGTTLLAAMEEGRRAVGIEINEDDCRVAVERLRRLSMWSVME